MPVFAIFLIFVALPTLAVCFCGEQEGSFSQQVFALFDHEIFRVEGLAGGDGRAVDGASAALEARAHVEQLFPCVLLDLRDAEGFGVFEILDWGEAAARAHVAEE